MLYNFITYFLIFTSINIIWTIDLVFVFFICLIVLGVLYIKDILKDNVLYVLLIFMSFISSQLLIQFHETDKSNYNFSNHIFQIEGLAADVSLRNTGKVVSLEVDSIRDLSENRQIKSFPRYINISVSPLNRIERYDKISVIGEISKTNFQNGDIYLGDKKFISRNDIEKLFLNVNYNVSSVKEFEVNNKSTTSETTWLKVKRMFYETSKQTIEKSNLYIHDPYLSIAKGITYGDQDNIDKDMKQIFINSGLIHIMVLSGANVSFIIILIFYLLKLVPNLSNKFKVFTTSIFSFLFVFGTGLSAPSLRASIMVNTGLWSEYFSKHFNIFNSMSLSLFILTLINPHALLYSPSLHLSYLAICGLIFVAPAISKKVSEPRLNDSKILLILKHDKFKIIWTTFLGITISLGPYLLAMSGQINLVGVVASMLLEPVIMAVTILTFLVTITSYMSNFLANFLGILDSFFVSIILRAAEFLSQNIFITHTQINFNFVKVYYIFFIIWIYWNRDKNKFKF